jgi:hypothetical protein
MRRLGGVVVVLLAATSSASTSALAASVHVRAGRIAVSGTALVDIPLSRHAKPFRSYALSADRRYGLGDSFVGSSTQSVARRIAHVWLSFRDDAATGRRWLLGCAAAVPTTRGCKVAGKVSVASPPPASVGTPTLTGTPLAALVTAQPGSWSVTAPDGTTYTLNVPANSTFASGVDALTMQPVSALTPAGAAGRLVDGVMISPAGEAPPGATLTVKPASTVGASAYLVGFGGIETSGAAFALPIMLGRSATIPVTQLGGYGIAVSGRAARDASASPPACSAPAAGTVRASVVRRPRSTAARPAAAAASQPLTGCSSAADRAAQQSKALGNQLAAERAAELAGNGDPAAIAGMISAVTSAQQTLGSELEGVLAQHPTESLVGQAEVLTEALNGAERQLELMGDESDRSQTLSRLAEVNKWALTYSQQVCNSAPGGATSVDMVFQSQRIFSFERQAELLGFAGDPAAVIRQASDCFQRARFNLKASGTAKVDDGFENGSVTISADNVPIAGRISSGGGVYFAGADANLAYTDSSMSIDPQYGVPLGESASFASMGGVFRPGQYINWDLQSRIRCDQNHQFVNDKSMKFLLPPDGLWNDGQTVQLSGPITQGPSWSGAMQNAWGQVHKLDKIRIAIPVEQPPNPSFPAQPPFSESNSGSPPLGSWSYSATITAQQLPIG